LKIENAKPPSASAGAAPGRTGGFPEPLGSAAGSIIR